jgi:NADPH:quinone reductase-like Zn-dependent oxidoreductase
VNKVPEVMQAVTYRGFPGFKTPRLELVTVPKPGPGQVLIRTEASALNPIDWKLRKGVLGCLTPWAQLSPIPGFDFVGRIVDSGADSADFVPGDRVFGMLNFRTLGSLAEYLIADAADLAFAGQSLDPESLAGLPLAGMTALQSIRDLGQLKAHQRLLVIGGSGGVGHLAVQIGKAMGAHVTAITGPTNVDFVAQLGADDVQNYAEGDRVKGPFDVILDAVVSQSYGEWKQHLSASGTYVSALPTLELLIRSRITQKSSAQKVRIIGVRPRRTDLEYLRALSEKGALTVAVDSRFRLEQASQALDRSQSGRARGKIIVST